MKVRVVLDYDEVVDAWSAVCPELPGCASSGTTRQDALDNIEEAIELYLEPTPIKLPTSAHIVEVTVG